MSIITQTPPNDIRHKETSAEQFARMGTMIMAFIAVAMLGFAFLGSCESQRDPPTDQGQCGSQVTSWRSHEYYRSRDVGEALVRSNSKECAAYLDRCQCWSDDSKGLDACPCRRYLSGVTIIKECVGTSQIDMTNLSTVPWTISQMTYSTSNGRLIGVSVGPQDGDKCNFYSDQVASCVDGRVVETRCMGTLVP